METSRRRKRVCVQHRRRHKEGRRTAQERTHQKVNGLRPSEEFWTSQVSDEWAWPKAQIESLTNLFFLSLIWAWTISEKEVKQNMQILDFSTGNF